MKLRILLMFLAIMLPCGGAFKEGDTVYAKRLETSLLAEPKPLAGPVAKVEFAQALKVAEVRGLWLRVSTRKPKVEGWVYAGNIADEEPKIPPATGMTAASASKTGVVAAARALTEAAQQYAQMHNQPTGSTEWLAAFSASVTEEDVTRYLAENRKGEYKQ